MNWQKKGRIFDPQNSGSKLVKSYAALPVTDLVSDELLRIYFSCRDEMGRSVLTYLETEPGNPSNIRYVHDQPVLPLGDHGTFDDNGIMPSWIVNDGNKKLLYYIGWNPQVTVSYRLSIGLAISEDEGRTFKKYSAGPICDRSHQEPFFNTAPCVLKEGDEWKMWYVSCTGWKTVNGWPEPYYDVKYASSKDGINWQKSQITCIGYDDFTTNIGKPCVLKEAGLYKMYYSYRYIADYRENKNYSYRLGYAESLDGINWERKDEQTGISLSEEGWDSIMMEYCNIYRYKNEFHMIYNGNGFGREGFGHAVRNVIL